MEYVVTPLVEEHIAGYRAAFDQVAHEHRFLDYLEAPPAAAVQKFVLSNIRDKNPQFVALADNTVVGWCVIAPKAKPIYQHAGVKCSQRNSGTETAPNRRHRTDARRDKIPETNGGRRG